MKCSIKWKFFISYLIIVIPLLVTSAVVQTTTANVLEKEVKYSNLLRIKQVSDDFQHEIAQLNRTAERIYIDNTISLSSMSRNEYNCMKGMDSLLHFRFGDEYLADVGICFHSEQIYLSEGMASLDIYTKYNLRATEDEAIRIKYALLNGVNTALYALNDERLLYICQEPARETISPNTSIVFEMDMSVLREKLQNLLGEYSGMAVLTLDGNIICQAGEGNWDVFTENDTHNFIVQSGDVLDMGLQVRMATAMDIVLAPVIRIRNIIWIVFCVGLVVSLFCAYALSNWHYHPIRDISDMLDVTQEHNQNEMAEIHHAIDNTLEQKRALSSLVDESRRMIRLQSLSALFHGLCEDETQMERMLTFAQLPFLRYPQYACAMVILSETNAEADKHLIELSECYPLSMLWQDTSKMLAIMVGLQKDEREREQIDVFAANLNDIMLNIGCTEWRLCVGKPYASLTMLHHSLLEAVAAFKTCKPENKVILFSEVMECENSENAQEFHWQDALHTALLSGNFEDISELLEEIRSFALNQETMKQYNYYQLIHEIYISMIELGSEQTLAAELLSLDTENTDRFFAQLRDVLTRLFADANAENAAYNPLSDILDYVRENYANPDMSLELLAEHFQLSKGYISRLFKEGTQKRYIDFLSEVRISQARKLLRETDMSVRAIVEAIGYIDPISFTRKFKQFHGITPNEYRENCIKMNSHP